jgi:hypothetical protein
MAEPQKEGHEAHKVHEEQQQNLFLVHELDWCAVAQTQFFVTFVNFVPSW